jgi:DNA-binding MarR family transcriptional regulator
MKPGSLNDNIAYLFGDASHRIYQNIRRIFRENKFKVTIEQFSVLTLLWYEDGLKQQDIANLLNRDKTTITRVISNMIRQNLVVRVTDKTDRRVSNIYLTHYGRELENKMVIATGDVYVKMLNSVSEKEIEEIIRILNKIINNLK